MYGLVVLLFLLVLPQPDGARPCCCAILIVMVIWSWLLEGYLIGRRSAALAAERYPGESTRGVGLYAAMRALQIRQLRFPKPRVKPGAEI